MGLSNELSHEAGSFSCSLNPYRFFQSEVLRLYFPSLEPCVAWSVSLPTWSSRFICMQKWDCLLCQPQPTPVLQLLPCQESSPPRCPSPPLLSVWLNVSSLTPWSSDGNSSVLSVLVVFCFQICCCPSFGCARRQSVSTYTSILARSSISCLFDNNYSNRCEVISHYGIDLHLLDDY